MSETAEDKAQQLVGTTLGQGYRLDALIGQGAMGAVYRSTTASGDQVAVKTLYRELMGGETSQRFLRESELVRRLQHPHVVRTLDSGEDSATGLMYLVMPLLKGRDLDHVLDELGALDPQTAVRIALQAARGLSAAHRIGIIHRDVKPGNLILDEDGGELVVRVCDFGIAKQMGGSESLTATGSQLGTPDYVSPEQLKSSKHVDERADVWSLGATLYQMLCGAAPFAHIDSVFDVITAIMSEDVPHLQDRAPWLNASLCLVVHKALMRDPHQRWATLEDMADALRPFSGGDELLEPSQIRPVSAATRNRVESRAALRDPPKQTSLTPAPTLATDELGLSASRRLAHPSKPEGLGAGKDVTATPTIAGSASRRATKPAAAGSSKTILFAVGLLSAALAGGSAYFFARGDLALPASLEALVSPARVSARLRVEPPEAQLFTRDGPVPVLDGEAVLSGQAGETLDVTLQLGSTSKTFSVSLGSDGIATPGRLVLEP